MKYFFLGCFSSAFFLYGVALLYGLTGSLAIVPLTPGQFQGDNPLGIYLSFGFILIGLAFKLGLFPFHAWVPDVYQGSPTSVTTFMSGMVKVAAVAAFIRIMVLVFCPVVMTWSPALWIVALTSMVFGNLVALRQRSVKRVLAYSSIAHAGYIALGLTSFVGDPNTLAAVLFYVCTYALVSIGAFGVVLLREVGSDKSHSGDDIADFNGLAKRSPWLAASLALFLLTLAGLPPGMVGLIGKLQLFGEAIRGEFYGLALIGILSSVVGVYYYLRVIAAMYFLPAPEVSGAATTLPESIPWLSRIGLAVVVAIVVAVGFYPEPLIRLVRTATSRLITTTSSDSVSSPGPSVSA